MARTISVSFSASLISRWGRGVVRAGRSARVPREQFLVETGRHGRARKTS
jgi:hypothetical protein